MSDARGGVVLRRARPEDHEAAGEVTVAVTRDHWLYLRLDGGGTLSLDGQRVLAAAGETKRWVKAGEHRLLLSGSAQRLVVRTIPEIFAYMVEWHNTPGPAASYHYTKEFLAQYLLPHCTTLVSNAAAPYAPDAAAWQAAGGTWICNQGIEQLRKPEVDLVAYWRGILSQPMFDAVLHDEVLGQDPPHYRRWAEAMPRALAGLPGKRIYYWTPWSVFGEPDWQDYFSLDRNQPGEGQVAMRCAASPDKLRTFRQSGLKLKAGQRYTLSCLMRATALEAQATPGADGYDGAFSGVFIINSGWFTHGGSLLGADLAGPAWKRVSKTFTMPYSRDGEYQLLLCPPAKGTLWVDDLRLEPGNTVGGGENAVVNGGFEAEWSGWPSPDHFEILRKAVQDNDCRIAIEAYQNEMADEASLQQALQGRLIGGLAALLKAYPGFGPYVTVAFSGGNAPLRYSNDIHPEICWKTNLDRQFHAAANSPVFESVGGIGDWTLHYLDEEGVRWYGALYRHYLIEGSRAPLAAWPYQLNHVSNPGFETGVAGWRLAGEAQVVEREAAFGTQQKSTYAPVPQAKHVLRTVPGARFSQTIRNLAPGQAYALKLYVTDARWSKASIAADIRIDGGQPLSNLDEHRVWTMSAGESFWNMHRRVFRATAETAQLTIGSDTPGEVFWDFIQVEPYFEG